MTRPWRESNPDHVTLQVPVQDPVEDVCVPQQSLEGIRRSTLLCQGIGNPSSRHGVIAKRVLTRPRDLGMVQITRHRETLTKGVQFLAAPDHRQLFSTHLEDFFMACGMGLSGLDPTGRYDRKPARHRPEAGGARQRPSNSGGSPHCLSSQLLSGVGRFLRKRRCLRCRTARRSVPTCEHETETTNRCETEYGAGMAPCS